jgi:hypothetical protein
LQIEGLTLGVGERVSRMNAAWFYNSTDSYNDLPELVHVEIELEWIEEKLPAVAKDLYCGYTVIYYQVNNNLSVTIKKPRW